MLASRRPPVAGTAPNQMSYLLTEIRRLPEERRLRLTWSDGHSAEYEYDYVRGYCPCAMCQGHGAFKIEFQAPSQSVEPTSIEPVGNYGVSFLWSDSHATGIYRFDFLRAICPCDACRERREGQAIDDGGSIPIE